MMRMDFSNTHLNYPKEMPYSNTEERERSILDS
jgi:hypothetical protein